MQNPVDGRFSGTKATVQAFAIENRRSRWRSKWEKRPQQKRAICPATNTVKIGGREWRKLKRGIDVIVSRAEP